MEFLRKMAGIRCVLTASFVLLLVICEVNKAASAPQLLLPFDSFGKCQPHLFRCDTGICIPSEWVCDGREDCLSGEDEFCGSRVTSGRVPFQHVNKRDSDDVYPHEPSLMEGALRLIHEANIASLEGTSLRKRQGSTGSATMSTAASPSGSSAASLPTTVGHIDQNNVDSTSTFVTTQFTRSSTGVTEVSTSESSSSSLSTENSEPTANDSSTNLGVTVTESSGSAETTSTSREKPTSTSTSEDLSEGSTTQFSSGSPGSSSVSTSQTTLLSSKSTAEVLTSTENTTTTDSMTTTSAPTSIESKLMELHHIAKELIVIKKHLEKKLDNLNTAASCSTPTGPVSTTEHYGSISKTTCLPDFLSMGGHCIYVQIYPPESWPNAEKICRTLNGRLVSIPSKKFFESLLKLLGFDRMRIYDFWIGVSNSNYQSKWLWQDGEHLNDMNMWRFDPRKTYTYHRSALVKPYQCGFMDGKVYSYINAAHCLEHKGFICQAPSSYGETFYE